MHEAAAPASTRSPRSDPGLSARRRAARIVLLLALMCESVAVPIGLNTSWHGQIRWIELAGLVSFAVSIPALARSGFGRDWAAAVILGVGVLLQLGAVLAAPTSSDDVYRYVWDGKVQLSGIDPYRYPPAAPELGNLRSANLFGDPRHCAWQLPDATCTRINRPEVRTVYPPVAEGAFTLARIGSLAKTDSTKPLQVLAALTATLIAALLVRRARSASTPMWTVAVWAWCPVTVVELGNNGHIDGLAVLLSVLALSLSASHRPVRAGVMLGAAVLTKLYPGLLWPVLAKRRPVRVTIAAGLVATLAYLPHVVAVGPRVIGFLPGYLREEGYQNGSRFLLISAPFSRHFVTGHAALLAACAALLLAVIALTAGLHADPDRPEQTAVWLTAGVLAVTTPSYSWYALLLLALIAMSNRPEWLLLAVLPTIAMLWADHVGTGPGLGSSTGFRTACYALGLACGLAGSWWRAHKPHRRVVNAPRRLKSRPT
jgi:alpha-1,2-mannosyltransferase